MDLDAWIKRHEIPCKDLGPEPEFNKNPFWKESDKPTAKNVNEHTDEQAEQCD